MPDVWKHRSKIPRKPLETLSKLRNTRHVHYAHHAMTYCTRRQRGEKIWTLGERKRKQTIETDATMIPIIPDIGLTATDDQWRH